MGFFSYFALKPRCVLWSERMQCSNYQLGNLSPSLSLSLDFIYLFLEIGEGKEKGRETVMCGSLLGTPPTGDLACNPSMCPDWESNWQLFGFQAHTQSTELYQPGLTEQSLNLWTLSKFSCKKVLRIFQNLNQLIFVIFRKSNISFFSLLIF